MLAENGAELLENRWLGAAVRHRIRCSNGHEVTAHPYYASQGGGICRVCAGLDPATAWQAFRETVKRLGGTVLESEWRNSNVRHLVRCAEGHENMVMPATVQQGGGICKTCARCDPAAAEAGFRQRLAERGAVLLEERWLGAAKPHRIRCAAGHLLTVTPHNVRGGKGICGTCAGNYRGKGSGEFFARLRELGATVIDTEWKGGGAGHHAICANGHDCYPRPNAVKQGAGICLTCAGQNMDEAAARFAANLAKFGATLLEPYRGANKPHRAICAEGHECFPWPTVLQQGGGPCRVCAHRDWDAFYVVTDQARGRVKFGITSGDAKVRLRAHARAGYRTVDLLLAGLPGTAAPEMERAAIATLRLAEIDPLHGREYFDISALPVIFDVAGGYAPEAEAA